ncbi:MAG: response regulator [SAR324 cluster bacterium]|nr:response regulator [SAR324 cluster bacterium]
MKCKILIAEDQEGNRFYLQGILEDGGHDVTAAENGKVALHLFQKEAFDLVITDIQMPIMDGLSLLRAIKKDHPETPVIIISALSELENVITALRDGACDFITKPYEDSAVYNSLDRVFRLIDADVKDRLNARYLKKESRSFEFDGNPDEIDFMARFLCQSLPLLDLKAKIQPLQVSLIEALSNAVFHGNLELPSSLKKNADCTSFKIFQTLARDRLKQKPYSSRKVTIDYTLDKKKVSYVIRDEGPGFDTHKLPDPLDPKCFLNPSGRGLLMIRTFCDTVTWNEAGNEITLVKYRED